jgi:hypothetical protein
VLGAIFQHSPAVILVPSRARIGALSELAGHRLMDAPGSDDIAAMLKHEGVDYASLPRVQHDGDPRAGRRPRRCDGCVQHERALRARPARGSLSDLLTARLRLRLLWRQPLHDGAAYRAYPERTRAFLAATIKGWAYALAHKDATVQLILDHYSKKKSREALLFEAAHSEALIQPDLINLGSQTNERWQEIANTYHDLGMLPDARVPED